MAASSVAYGDTFPHLGKATLRSFSFISALFRCYVRTVTRAGSFHRSAVPLPPGGRLSGEPRLLHQI